MFGREVRKLQHDAEEDWREQSASLEILAIGVQEMEEAVEQGRQNRIADRLEFQQELAESHAQAVVARRLSSPPGLGQGRLRSILC
eukprot:9980759-Heterocapsa_arctica.AAC.1